VHLGFFRSVADIARAKKELIDTLPPEATAVLNADDEYVAQFDRDFHGRVVTYGLKNPADVRAESVEDRGLLGSRFNIVMGNERHALALPLIGRHNVYNALAAVAVATQHGVTLAAAATELAAINAVDKRGELLEIGGATVINDCYNSNPRALDSMVDALAGVAVAQGARRVIVAGEMLELGAAGEDLHRRCGAHLADRGIDVLIGVRGLAKAMVEGARARRGKAPASNRLMAEFMEAPELAGEWLAREIHAGDVVLLKASRGVRLERALETWRSRVQA
jgi:UDP-N-acetylmuramoyl-tripeptide--D-alanyl-D-alanine ligase